MGQNQKIADLLLEVIPPIMHLIRKEVRSAAKSKLTIPQLRVLAHLSRQKLSIGELAEIQGVTQPTMSKIVNGLVHKGYLDKAQSSLDRRQQDLKLTGPGESVLQEAKLEAKAQMSDMIGKLRIKDSEKKQLFSALQALSDHLLDNL